MLRMHAPQSITSGNCGCRRRAHKGSGELIGVESRDATTPSFKGLFRPPGAFLAGNSTRRRSTHNGWARWSPSLTHDTRLEVGHVDSR
jgi:hypothetical protein